MKSRNYFITRGLPIRYLAVLALFFSSLVFSANSKRMVNDGPKYLKSYSSALNLHSSRNYPLPEPPERLPSALVPRFMRPMRIMIDAGHGGHDEGAHGILGSFEKNLSLKLSHMVAKDMKKKARAQKVPLLVRLSRTRDQFVSLRNRVKMANAWQADLFISIHGNASNSSRPRGFEVYYLSEHASDDHTHRLVKKENDDSTPQLKPGVMSIISDLITTAHIEESAQFAHVVHDVVKTTIRPNRFGVRQGPFTVLNGTEMPSILLEVGYLSNRQDARNLQNRDYLKRLVNAISSGILEYATHLRSLG